MPGSTPVGSTLPRTWTSYSWGGSSSRSWTQRWRASASRARETATCTRVAPLGRVSPGAPGHRCGSRDSAGTPAGGTAGAGALADRLLSRSTGDLPSLGRPPEPRRRRRDRASQRGRSRTDPALERGRGARRALRGARAGARAPATRGLKSIVASDADRPNPGTVRSRSGRVERLTPSSSTPGDSKTLVSRLREGAAPRQAA